MGRRLKLAIPWILSLSFVGYLLATVDLAQVRDAFLKADIGRLLPLIVGFTVLVFLADAGTLTLLFRRFLAPVRYGEVLAVKGASYFLNALNYNLAAGGMALFLKKKKGTSFLEGLSTLLWLNFVDILVLVVMLSVGMVFAIDLLPQAHQGVLPWLLGGFSAIAVGVFVYWNLGFDFLVMGRFRSWRIFTAFRNPGAKDYLVMLLARGAFISLYVLLTWLALPCFDIEIVLASLLIYVPLLTFVQIVPASISGFGAIQEVMILLYSPYVLASVTDPSAQVFAFSLVIGPFAVLLRVLIGYFFVKNVASDFVSNTAELEAARSEEEAVD